MTATNPTAYIRLKPCVDAKGHNFRVYQPPAGQFGYSETVCTRCGHTAQEVRV
jgi:hypothetical protein